MGKAISDSVFDASLDYIANNCVRLSITADTTTPANMTNQIAFIAVASGQFSKANGDSSGRKITMAAVSSIAVNSTGVASHIVLSSSGGANLHVITTCTSQSLTQGNSVATPAFDFEITDPT
jgi:hypothetical protein